jgi:hypothetical protein
LANVVAVFRVYVLLQFTKHCIDQAAGGKWDVKDVIVATNGWGAIKSKMSAWLRKRSLQL